MSNLGRGIVVGFQGFVATSTAYENGGGGIVAKESVIKDCNASRNTGHGIDGRPASTIVHCTANENSAQGIIVSGGEVSACTVASNQGGIDGGSDSMIVGSRVGSSSPGEDCIKCEIGCVILNNTVGNCSTSAPLTGAAIRITPGGHGNRVEGNNVIGSAIGIAAPAGNAIFKNSARGNGTNYAVVVGDAGVGPIGPASTSTSPWANISY